ncbi:MAG: subclass B1 metallo-beta-lactamase [Flavobacteriales bacterium]|nr:subclass B1 metallo-beta-lactamase [Flavobacteriales bacterium]
MKAILTLFVLITFFISNTNAQKTTPEVVFESAQLKIEQLSKACYLHTSYLETDQYGKVTCNGFLFFHQNEAIVFDTPTNDSASYQLIEWIKTELNCKVKAVVVGHFHDDCLGGLKAFHQSNIASYANQLTIELAQGNNIETPRNVINAEMEFTIGQQKIFSRFFGEGHSRDNIVSYIPSEQALFGGCLIKTLNASKGYLGDANIDEWSNTVRKIQKEYPDLKIVVPGHGKSGGTELLEYTIELFK